MSAAPDVVFEDFEGPDWGAWTVTGTAFGSGPISDDEAPSYQGDFVAMGNKAVNSHATSPNGDTAKGSLWSPVFTVTHDYIHFFIGGGNRANKLRVRLVDASTGNQLRISTGNKSDAMRKKFWDVSALIGTSVKIHIQDNYAGAWGNIGCDHIVFSDNKWLSLDGYLTAERWADISSFDVKDLVMNDKFFDDADVLEVATPSYTLMAQYSGARLRGYITAPETGNYTFWVSASTAGELWLSTDDTKYRKQLLAELGGDLGTGSAGVTSSSANRWDKFASQMSEEVHLQAGQTYYLEMLSQQHHVSHGDRHISVAWARPSMAREEIPQQFITSYIPTADDADDDSLPDAWEATHGLDSSDNGLVDRPHQGERGDFDMDGLSNREEYVLGTDPSNPDTDGDSLTDSEEIRSYSTDPLASDAPSESLVSSLDLTSYLNGTVSWTMTSQGLIPSHFRGATTWNFTVPSDGYWAINVFTTLLGDLYLNEAIDFEVSINGQSLGLKNLVYGRNRDAILRILTPHLTAGQHSLTINVHNMLARRMVSITDIQILEPTGADLNADGYPDWIFSNVSGSNTLESYSPLSRTSPAFLEGSARFINQVALPNSDLTRGLDQDHWYANLPLNSSGSTSFTVSYESNISETGAIQWEATNVLDGETLIIRKNDSLKLVAQPLSGSTGQATTLHLPDTNWARASGVTTTQKTTAAGGVPSRAIDGNTSGLWADASLSMTTSKRWAWFKVDLGQQRSISRIKLWNRTDGDFGQRLSRYRISVLDTSGATVISKDLHVSSGFSGETELWTLPSPVLGSAVKIQKIGKGRLDSYIISLAEVEVFGGGGDLSLASDTDHSTFKFEEPGTTSITATHADGTTGELLVTVKQAEFSAIPRDLLGNTAQTLNFASSDIDSDLFFEGGESVFVKNPANLTGANFSMLALPRGGGSSNLLARLYEGGPIVGKQELNLIGIADALQSDLTTSFFSRDFTGYTVLTAPVVATDLPPGGTVIVRIYRAGVTFLDGTKTLVLSADDFVNDTYNLEFLFPIGMSGGYCHHIDIYDRNGAYLGRR